jgi:hypothetical protein
MSLKKYVSAQIAQLDVRNARELNAEFVIRKMAFRSQVRFVVIRKQGKSLMEVGGVLEFFHARLDVYHVPILVRMIIVFSVTNLRAFIFLELNAVTPK